MVITNTSLSGDGTYSPLQRSVTRFKSLRLSLRNLVCAIAECHTLYTSKRNRDSISYSFLRIGGGYFFFFFFFFNHFRIKRIFNFFKVHRGSPHAVAKAMAKKPTWNRRRPRCRGTFSYPRLLHEMFVSHSRKPAPQITAQITQQTKEKQEKKRKDAARKVVRVSNVSRSSSLKNPHHFPTSLHHMGYFILVVYIEKNPKKSH